MGRHGGKFGQLDGRDTDAAGATGMDCRRVPRPADAAGGRRCRSPASPEVYAHGVKSAWQGQFAGALGRLASLLLPSACALCGTVQPDVVCDGCATDLLAPDPRCRLCAMPGRFPAQTCHGCRQRPPPFSAAVTLGHYDRQRDTLVLALKHGGRIALANWLGRALARRWAEAGGASPDLILPVPLSAERLAERGFNQAWEIARAMGRAMGVRTSSVHLLRARHTAVQASLDLQARQPNLAGAFRVAPGRDPQGLHVAIVDDVMTTGATLAEAAAVLNRHGAAHVTAFAALRTP